MILLLITILGIFLILIFLFSYKKYKDIFCPLCFFSFYQFVQYIPAAFYKQSENGIGFTYDNIFRFYFIESLSIISLLFGYYIYNKYFNNKSEIFVEYYTKVDGVIPIWMILLLYSIGLFTKVSEIKSVGGIRFILNNSHEAYRSTINRSAYYSLIASFMLISIIMYMNRVSKIPKEYKYKRAFNYLIIVIMVAISMFTYLVFTRRSPALELLMFVIFAYHYLIKKIRIIDLLNPKFIILIILSIMIVIVMPALRQSGQVGVSLTKILNEFSCLGRDVGTYDYFSKNEKWLGTSYLGFFTSFIPSSIYPNKLPVDDGLYLCNILYGYNISPPMPVKEIPFYNSIPFTSQGALYANFGVIGIILGEMLLGFIYAHTYKKLTNTKSDYMVIVYQLVIYQLELTSLGIVQTLIPLITAYFVYRLFKGMKIRKQYMDLGDQFNED